MLIPGWCSGFSCWLACLLVFTHPLLGLKKNQCCTKQPFCVVAVVVNCCVSVSFLLLRWREKLGCRIDHKHILPTKCYECFPRWKVDLLWRWIFSLGEKLGCREDEKQTLLIEYFVIVSCDVLITPELSRTHICFFCLFQPRILTSLFVQLLHDCLYRRLALYSPRRLLL